MPPRFLTGVDDGGGWRLIHSLSAAVGVKQASRWHPGICPPFHSPCFYRKPVLINCWLW